MQVALNQLENTAGNLSAFASDLALPAGRFPTSVTVVGGPRGPEMFLFARKSMEQGELVAVEYAYKGRLLTLFND